MAAWTSKKIQRLPDHVPFIRNWGFPGKVPVHLCIRVFYCVKGRSYTVFSYNGKWKFSALQAARRVAIKYPLASSFVQEYLPFMRLYSGSLERGWFYAARNHFIRDPNLLNAAWEVGRPFALQYTPIEYKVVPFEGRKVMIPLAEIPAKEDHKKWRLLRLKVRTYYNRGVW